MGELINGLRTYRPSLEKYVYCSEALRAKVEGWIKDVPTGAVSRNLLITGPSGSGKTSLGIAASRQLGASQNDTQEINCASMRTLEDARTLLDTLYYSPTRGDYRVLVLDEVHQMVQNAQQAFLTPLEQLPSTTIVIACTSNPELLLPSFKRRFYELKITEYPEDAMIEILSCLPAKLKPSAMATIVKLSGGNPGRAIALAESNPNAGDEEGGLVQEILTAEKFYSSLLEGDRRGMFLYAQQVKEENRRSFFEKVLSYLEASWMVSMGLNVALPSKDQAMIQAQVSRLVWQKANSEENGARRSQFLADKYKEFLEISEKPVAHLKAWAMRQ